MIKPSKKGTARAEWFKGWCLEAADDAKKIFSDAVEQYATELVSLTFNDDDALMTYLSVTGDGDLEVVFSLADGITGEWAAKASVKEMALFWTGGGLKGDPDCIQEAKAIVNSLRKIADEIEKELEAQ